MRSLDVQLSMARSNLTYGNVEGGRPVEFTLETLEVLHAARRALTARLRGTLLGERFAAELRSGDLPTIASDQRVPAKLTASAPGATLTVDGTLAAPRQADRNRPRLSPVRSARGRSQQLVGRVADGRGRS